VERPQARATASRDLARARVGVAVVFFAYGAVFGTWAARVPAIKAELGLGDGELGTALLAMAAGTFAGARLGGWPTDRFGARATSTAGTALLSAALAGPALAGDLAGLAVALAALGFAGGLLDVAVNAEAVAVERLYRRPLLSGLHGLWSLGGLAGAAAGGLAAGMGASPDVHFGVAAAVLGLGGLAALRALRGIDDTGARPVAWAAAPLARARVLWSPAVLLLGLVGFSAYLAEGSAADWSAVYLREGLGTAPGFAAAGFAAFSFAMVGSRLVGDRLVARFGPVLVVRAGAVIAAGGLALGLATHRPEAAVAAFGLLGFGMGPIVPITFSAAGNSPLGPTGAILGRVVALSYVGSVAGPVMIGWIAEATSLRAALALPVVLGLVVAAAAGRVIGAAAGRSPN